MFYYDYIILCLFINKDCQRGPKWCPSKFSNPISDIISRALIRRNFYRIVEQSKHIAKDKQDADSPMSCYRNTQVMIAQNNGRPIMRGIPRVIFLQYWLCCENFINDIAKDEKRLGRSFREIYSCICETSHRGLSSLLLHLEKVDKKMSTEFNSILVNFYPRSGTILPYHKEDKRKLDKSVPIAICPLDPLVTWSLQYPSLL